MQETKTIWTVTDGSKSQPAGHVGSYGSRAEAEDARARLCRMGGYIRRETFPGAKTTAEIKASR